MSINLISISFVLERRFLWYTYNMLFFVKTNTKAYEKLRIETY